MPHIHDMVGALFEPSRVNGPLLIDVLFDAALFTAKEAAVGFVLGASLGFALGVVLAHSRLLSRGLMPYVVASQTIPILAIAPMVVIGLGTVDILGWTPSDWQRVSVIAAYLSFFPVTINTVRGLNSADPRAVELMRSYAAGTWSILWKLPFPRLAALPVHRAQDRRHGVRRRRDRRRAALVDPGGPRRRDPQLQPVLHARSREPLGDEHHRRAARHLLLPRDRDRGEARRAPRSGACGMSGQPVVAIQNVSKTFLKGEVTALEGITLDLAPGEFVSLIGPSGCGKSTLLRVIGDLVEPTSGTVTVNGKRRTRRGSTATTGSSSRTLCCSTGGPSAKNIALPLELLGWDGRGGPRGCRSCSSSSSSPASRSTIPGSSPAACSSASRSPGRSRSSPRSC